jgi:hypothetical protein
MHLRIAVPAELPIGEHVVDLVQESRRAELLVHKVIFEDEEEAEEREPNDGNSERDLPPR